MKKYVILSLFLLTICCQKSIDNHIDKNDLDKLNLYGKVKQYKLYEYENGVKKPDDCEMLRIFDKNGNLIEHFQYNDDKMTVKTTFIYDKNHYRTESNGIINIREPDINRYLYKYDANGNLIEDKYFRGFPDLELVNITKYVYSGGKKVKEIQINGEAKQLSTTEFKYNDKGEVNEKSWYYSQGLGNTELLKYDERGNTIESITIYPEVNRETTIFYKYDDYNNIISKKSIIDNVTDLIMYEYTYDEKGNWLKKIEKINDTIVKITERDFKYF